MAYLWTDYEWIVVVGALLAFAMVSLRVLKLDCVLVWVAPKKDARTLCAPS